MFDIATSVDSLTSFKRQTPDYLARLRKTGKPIVLTVNGKAEVVVQDAAAYARLVEAATRAERDETIALIREGLADVKSRRTKPARAVLKSLAKKYGIELPEQ